MDDNDTYQLLPSTDECQYVEFDADEQYWGVFGSWSGFCYGRYDTEEQAELAL